MMIPEKILMAGEKPAIVNEILFDLDRKEQKRFISEIKGLQCPYCEQWSLRIRRIDARFLREGVDLPLLITASGSATPRHKWHLEKGDHDNLAHSDNKFQGWAGYHKEEVWGFYPAETEAQIEVIEEEEMLSLLKVHAHSSHKRARAVITTHYPISPPIGVKQVPHHSCLLDSISMPPEGEHLEFKELEIVPITEPLPEWVIFQDGGVKIGKYKIGSPALEITYKADGREFAFAELYKPEGELEAGRYLFLL